MLFDKVLRDKLIPWSENAASRIIVAGPQMQRATLPASVRLEKRTLRGKRVIIKNRRYYQNTRALSARWPDCGLNEVILLKMACVISGAVDFQVGKQSLLTGPGHLIVIPPGTPHPDGRGNITDRSKSTFCELIYFLLYPNALQCWTDRHGETPSHDFRKENYLFTNQRLVQMFRIFMEESIESPESVTSNEKLFQALVQLLQKNFHDRTFMTTVSGKTQSILQDLTPAESLGERLHVYIISNLQEAPTLDSTARALHLSRTQLARRIKQETGKTFLELLNERRLETAKELLINTDWTVSSIASFIGYKNSHYFHPFFRRETKMTPNRYRQAARQERMDE